MERFQKWATPIGALGIALIVGALLLRVVTNLRSDLMLFLAAVGVVLVGFYFIARPRDNTRQASNVRIALQGTNVIVLALAFVGVLIALNYIVFHQFNRRVDLTTPNNQVLSDKTLQVLQSLNEPVQVTGFFTPATEDLRTQAEAMMREYQAKSDKIAWQIVDPDANPTVAQKYQNIVPGTLVFEKGARNEKVYDFDENNMTNAILKVGRAQEPAVYFLTGHGEYLTDDTAEAGLSTFAQYLRQLEYKVDTINLATISGTLPADTSAIIIAGPTSEFTPENNKLLQDYLDNGGRVLLMSDPGTKIGLDALLKSWGLELEQDLVLDPGMNYGGNISVPVIAQFPDSPITQGLNRYGVFFVGASSIKNLEGGNTDATALFNTSADACVKTDLEAIKEDANPQCAETDPKGPFAIGFAAEGAGKGGANEEARARLLVLGNASFATNRLLGQADATGNQQLVRNMVNWLLGEVITIEPRDPVVRPLSAMSGGDEGLVFWTSVILLPLTALLIGGLLWWRRR